MEKLEESPGRFAGLEQVRQEHDLPPEGALRTADGVAFSDDIVRHLGDCIACAFERPDAASRLFVDYVAMALLAHLAARHGAHPAVVRPIRGGLAPWQERRAKEMLMASMTGKIGLDELAGACGLSRSHFARAFKATTGTSPLQWLRIQRIERAKDLLLNSSLPIEEIADRCGFADQSHFTRAFLGAVNVTPGLWRRLGRT